LEAAFSSGEIAALSFGAIIFAIVVSFFLYLAATVDLAYKPVQIICSHVPDDGVHVSFTAERSFSIFSGSMLSVSGDEIMDKCVSLFSENVVEDENSAVDWDIMEEDLGGELGADVLAELDAVEGLQSAADANALQQADSGKKIIIAAHYNSWKQEGVNRIERDFSVLETGADDIDEDDKDNLHEKDDDDDDGNRRRLSGGGLSAAASGSTFSSVSLSTPSKPYTYIIDLFVDSGRYDGSRGEITLKIFGKNSEETSFLNLGKSFAKNEERQVTATDSVDVTHVSKLLLTTNSKDTLKFAAIRINRMAEGMKKGGSEANMKSSLKCRGSKRKGTWSCSQELSVKYWDNGTGEEADVEEDEKKGCRHEPCKYTTGPIDFNSISDFNNAILHRDEIEYPFGTIWNDCRRNGPSRFAHVAVCDGGCEDRHGSFKLSPATYFSDSSRAESGENSEDGGTGCQQKNGASYPKYCLEPLKNGAPWSMAGLKSKEQKAQCTKSVAHDRGHQVPANNWDGDKSIVTATNYMTNILPQAAQMNRGAWLRTEMLTECWRQEQPLTVIGGAVYITDPSIHNVKEWGEIDRSNWFMESHYVKNPAYYWKIVVAKETELEWGGAIAFWIPNHESASAKKIDDYIVPIKELEENLALWGEPEIFDGNLVGDKTYWPFIWPDPEGCWRG